MKIAYIYPEKLPSSKARTVSVINTASELSEIVNTTLFYEKSSDTKNILEFYNLKSHLILKDIAKQWILRSNKIFNHNLLKNIDKSYICYVRHLKTAKFLIDNGYKIIFEYHEVFTQNNKNIEKLENFVVTNASGLVFTNHSLVEQLRSLFDIDKIPKKVIYNGCGFKFKYMKKDFSKIDEIYYIGSFQSWKGVDFLVENMRFFPELELKIIGDGDKTKLFEIIKTYNLQNIQFLGFKNHSEIEKILQKSKLTIIPNTPSTFSKVSSPIKLYEYLMSSNIVLSADMETVQEIINDNENGFLFKSGDNDDFKKELQYIINLEPNELESISLNGFNTGRQFTWENRAKSIVEFLKSV